jgi:hypothetical protein
MRSRDAAVDAAVRIAALRAAERGWFVFPTRPGGKEPRSGLSWPLAATADLGRLARATWRPGENYGIAAKPSGLVIVDLDRPKPGFAFPPPWRDEPGVGDGADVLAVLAGRAGAGWPDTFTVATPSGGRHLYYVAPAGRPIGNKRLGPLVDVRGGGGSDGGYVLGPGSVLNGRPYEALDGGQAVAPLPVWIVDLLDPPQPARRQPAPMRQHCGTGRTAARLTALVAAVAGAQQGQRNNTLHWAACRAAEMIAAGQLAEDDVFDSLGRAAARAGLDDGEARRTIASAFRHQIRMAG